MWKCGYFEGIKGGFAQRLPKDCPKHIGVNHTKSKHHNQTIEGGFGFI
jgi:hypothetical protein